MGKISENILQFDPCKNVNEASPLKYMKKRFDLSPINQSRLSPGFNLFAWKWFNNEQYIYLYILFVEKAHKINRKASKNIGIKSYH